MRISDSMERVKVNTLMRFNTSIHFTSIHNTMLHS